MLQFAQFLKESHKKTVNAPKTKRDKPRLVGALEGKVWMSDDFNDPLEFVSPDEMRVLEAMHENTLVELHEVTNNLTGARFVAVIQNELTRS